MTNDETRDDASPASPEEQAEAAALAAALDATLEGRAETAPVDALEAAGLLRTAAESLSPRAAAEVLERVRPASTLPRPRRSWARLLVPVGGLAAVAAACLLVLMFLPGPPAATRLPALQAGLLRAQAQAVRGEGREAYAGELQAYRREVYVALQRRYREAS
jgi:hypothetical protein